MSQTGSEVQPEIREDGQPPQGLKRWIPALQWLPEYRASWLRLDALAGLTVVALLVPEGMAYAALAGVPPETAFYAAPAGLILYAIFGTSRQLVVAVSSAVAVTSASIIGERAATGSAEFITLTAALALVAGLVMIVAGLLRFGQISQFFSESVLTGFVFGLAMVIAIKQLPKMFGLEAEEGNFFERLWHLITELPDAHGRTVLVGLTSLALMLILERWFERIPAALVTLFYGIGISALLGMDGKGVEVVGDLPSGLAPRRSRTSWPVIWGCWSPVVSASVCWRLRRLWDQLVSSPANTAIRSTRIRR